MRFRLLPAMLLATFPALAGDYDALISAIRKAWPDKTHIAIVCDQAGSKGPCPRWRAPRAA
jgi:hypothetical protein